MGLRAGALVVAEDQKSPRTKLKTTNSPHWKGVFPVLGLEESLYLVDCEANGEEVGSQLPVLAPILLHQSHQEAADHLRVIRVVVLLQEFQTVLRVGPESVCAPPHQRKCMFRYEKRQEGKGDREPV